MKFEATKLDGVFVIELEPIEDERGSFARTFCRNEFAAHGLDPVVAQCNVSVNRHRHTLRGLHYQAAPHGEAKLIRCATGAIHDVVVDLRPGSATYRHWLATELTGSTSLYVPAGLAHGFLTLTDDATVLYQMSTEYDAASARGVRWDDPVLAIAWPAPPRTISARDAEFPLLPEAPHG